ncbi:MAG: membrane protein insertion efficiency factor YidD [Kiritimatiellae bacterium]|nr:membrane protein insertion efficiency factor YidD [Kiritimatiellia bacterium]
MAALDGELQAMDRVLPSAPQLRLAEALFAEANYPAAAIEARMVMRGAKDAYVVGKARLIRALAELRREDRIAVAAEQAVSTLEELWNPDAAPADGATEPAALAELRAFAAYELGRYRMSLRKGGADALPPLAYAFLKTRNTTLFQLAGCSLHFLFEENDELAEAHADLADQVAFALSGWSTSVWTLANPRTVRQRHQQARPALVSLPARGLIAFYRSQVRPAIGGRCALEPSCSEYFLQASKKHGLLGIPLIADRFAREPAVTQAAEVLVERPDGSLRIADPVDNHDFWFTEFP